MKLCLKVENKSMFQKKLQKILTPKFSCLKSWKTWLFGTWKSIFENFDDLLTSRNFEGLSDVERWWSEINKWNCVCRSEINQYYEKKLQKILNPQFSCLKSLKTWLFGTWKSNSEDFDDLWTCMNFEGLSDVERWWSEINKWNCVWRSEINQCFEKKSQKI